MKSNQNGFSAIEVLIIVGVVGLIGTSGWYVYHHKKQPPKTTTTTTTVTKTTTTTPVPAPAAVKPVSDALKENIAASIESQNTAALEGYMASSVNVVIAASEKSGAETATQAVKDLDYLNSGTSPWDFALSSATLTTYKDGSYSQYFGDRTVVGKSANNYVVSFKVNDSGKIDTVFMAANTDLLQ